MVETVSFATLFDPLANAIACAVVGFVVFILGWRKPTLGLAALLLENMVGSFGYLLQINLGQPAISLRIVMFATFFAGWLINAVQAKAFNDLKSLLFGLKPYFILAVLVVYAIVRGYLLGQRQFLVSDANAWLELAVLIPVCDIAYRQRERIRRDFISVIYTGIGWLAAKTFILEYLFAHKLGGESLSYVYVWVRRTGVGEITRVIQSAYRIFFQSHIFAVAAATFCASKLFSERHDETALSLRATAFANAVASAQSKSARQSLDSRDCFVVATPRNDKLIPWLFSAAAWFIIGLSLSRSFWLGTAAGLICLAALLIRKRNFLWSRVFLFATSAFAGVLLMLAALAFPLPPVSFDFGGVVSSRANLSEDAVVSRWQLLPAMVEKIKTHPILGSGFGSTIVYESKDPRVVALTGGRYETYAFEWGWLGFWVKFGVLGILVMVWILVSLGRRIWRLDEPLWLRAGAVATLFALSVVHFFTPYLNHPLGFAFLLVGEGLIRSNKNYAPRKTIT
ncbi:MAG: O-antigen ligase family protein [Patescibacteria group bacterium]